METAKRISRQRVRGGEGSRRKVLLTWEKMDCQIIRCMFSLIYTPLSIIPLGPMCKTIFYWYKCNTFGAGWMHILVAP